MILLEEALHNVFERILPWEPKVGGKASAITTLQVLDPCASAFDGASALVQIPPNQLGYWVYARALAKPTDNPYMTITPSLYMAQDENGNPLLFLGTVTSSGFRNCGWADLHSLERPVESYPSFRNV